MEGSYGFYRQGSSKLSALMNEELHEDEIWAIFKERKNYNASSNVASSDFSAISTRRMPTAARMIPRANDKVAQEPRKVRQSAPVSIPDWSKIYGNNSNKKSSKNVSWLDDVENHDDDGHDYDDRRAVNDEGDDGSDGDMIPPHEWIARRLSRSQISSFSVCEGAGRTLKGRDLSRVRNAVLSRTGFLE